jgi:uncharacterized protein
VQRILHAGDIGDAEVLEALGRVAPVTAVRGNNDHGPWTRPLPETTEIRVGAVAIVMTHIVSTLADPGALGASVVVFGHSHRPENVRRDGVLFFNPGSAGPRRFNLPVTLGRLDIRGRRVQGKIVPLL